jgi:hypothetical protein
MDLPSVYSAYVKGLWPMPSPFIEPLLDLRCRRLHPWLVFLLEPRFTAIDTALHRELVGAFSTGRLEALVTRPNSSECYCIPAASWAEANFPERLFMSGEVVHGERGYWERLAGKTPFLRRVALDAWTQDQLKLRSQNALGSDSALRGFLIDLAKYGVISPSDVDGLCDRWSLQRVGRPPASLNDLVTSRWTLCMTVSWIVRRDLHAVLDVADDYRASWFVWKPCRASLQVNHTDEWVEVEGEEPVAVGSVGLALMGVDQADQVGRKTASSGREELWDALSRGSVCAMGANSNGNVEPIPSDAWLSLQLASNSLGERDRLIFTGSSAGYADITLSAYDVQRCWPPHEESRPGCPADNPVIERSTIVLALDSSNVRVLFEQGPTFRGVAYHMFVKLVEQRNRDIAKGTSAMEFAYTRAVDLVESRNDGDALRQRLHQVRKKLAAFGLKDVIQSRRPRGYRLCPSVVVASVEQIRRHREISDPQCQKPDISEKSTTISE